MGGLAVHISPHKRNIGKALFHPLLSNDVLLKVEKTSQFARFEKKSGQIADDQIRALMLGSKKKKKNPPTRGRIRFSSIVP